MSTARTSTLASLRGRIERIETPGDAHDLNKVALGHAAADAVLRGGLAAAAVHEVFAEGHQSAAATGFIAGLAGRVSPRRPLVWVRQDFSEIELGALSMSGLCELGLDPRLLVTVRAPTPTPRCGPPPTRWPAMRSAPSCWRSGGRPASSISSPAANLHWPRRPPASPHLLLRMAAEPRPSTAETRWIVRAAHSPPSAPWSAWGAPVFDAQLVRNRHGPVGRWIMEWNCDECLFSEPAAYPQPVAATPAHRPHQAAMQAPDEARSETLTARTADSLSRLRGRAGVGVPPRELPF